MTTTTIKRDRKAESNATQTIRNMARWSNQTIGESKVWEALNLIGHRDGAEVVAIRNRCGLPDGGIEKAAAKGRRAIEETIGRELTDVESEAYGWGFSGAVYRD